MIRVVSERHRVQPDITPDWGKVHGVGMLGHCGFGGQQVPQFHYGGTALLVLVVELDESLDRREERG